MVTRTLVRWIMLMAVLAVGTPIDHLLQAALAQTQDASGRLYDRVMEEFRRKDYKAALAGFQLFLELHGQSALAANAYFWIGECQFRLGRYKEALASFYHVMSYYPLSSKLASAAWRIGQAYAKLGDHEKARIMYERVVNDYPDSTEAELARKALETLATKDDVLRE